MDKKKQDKTILTFLERIAKQIEKLTKTKGWKCSVNDKAYIEDEIGVYYIENELFIPSLIVEVNVRPEETLIFINTFDLAFFKNIVESLKEEISKAAKELGIEAWGIY